MKLNGFYKSALKREICCDIFMMCTVYVSDREVQIESCSEKLVEGHTSDLPVAPEWVDMVIKGEKFHLKFNENFTDENPTHYDISEVIDYLTSANAAS